jgi:hypothetical protein
MKRRVHTRSEAKLQLEEEGTVSSGVSSSTSSPLSHNQKQPSPNGLHVEEYDTMETSADEKKLCRAPGCVTPLTHLNNSGYCSRHFHFSRRKSNRLADAAGDSGSDTRSSSNRDSEVDDAICRTRDGAPEIKEDRLNQLILSWSLELKSRLAKEWLAGKI